MRATLALLVGLAALSGLEAQVASPATVVTASRPSRIAVTVYRNPGARAGQAMNLKYLEGIALVTETRTVRLPAGTAVVRFQGVVGGIIPVSAVITGLPGGTIEKNRDARLLSPVALIDGTLGRRVTLRRTNRVTGAVREDDATIVAGSATGVVLRTATGIETLRCSGSPETLSYSGIPPGLSAEPVLSVTTRSPRAATATVTLSYLANDFDWTASYVATILPDGQTLDLFAWMTLANANAQTLPGAEVSAVAGRLNRSTQRDYDVYQAGLQIRCYPMGTTTSDLNRAKAAGGEVVITGRRLALAPPPPPPPPAPPPGALPPEDLGDLKLYRVPARVAVAANQQKQVALLRQDRVPFERVYRARVETSNMPPTPVEIRLQMRNEVARGLGIPLPAGSTALYQRRGGERLLLGLGTADDTAVGQRFSIAAGVSSQVMIAAKRDSSRHSITLTNANRTPATVEVRIGSAGDGEPENQSEKLSRVDGVWMWLATVPANGTKVLTYGSD